MFSFEFRRLNKRLSKHLWGWWFETPWRSLWRHCYDINIVLCYGANMETPSAPLTFCNEELRPRFTINMPSYHNRKSHCRDKTVLWPSYLHNGIVFSILIRHLYIESAARLLDDSHHNCQIQHAVKQRFHDTNMLLLLCGINTYHTDWHLLPDTWIKRITLNAIVIMQEGDIIQ